MPTQPLPLTGQETGIDVGVGLQVFLITAEGKIVENPRHYRTAERELKKAPKRVSQRKQGTGEEPAQESGAGARQEASAGPPAAHGLSPQEQRTDFHPKITPRPPWRWSASTTRSRTRRSRLPT